MTFKSLTEAFLWMEEDLDLFDQRIDGVYFWERVRFGVHRKILEGVGVSGQAHTKLERTLANRVRSASRCTKNLVMKNPCLSPPADILIWGCARRKLEEDGKWWDIYYDPIIDNLDEAVAYFESPYLGMHYTPAKSENIRYMDLINCLAAMKRRLGLVRVAFGSKEAGLLQDLQKKISAVFNVKIDLKEMVGQHLLTRKATLSLYGRLLRRVGPKVVLLDNSYGRETFIEACKDLNIPAVELQHGTLGEYHLAYSYPGPKRVKRTFPDYFFAFGDFWKESVEFPIGKERIFSVGYPYFEKEKEKYAHIHRKDQLLFISQGTIGAEISKFAVELSEREDFSLKIIYKLHPGEYARWRKEYPWLMGTKIKVIDSDNPPLYKLFAESKIQIGGNSTAIYEGLGFGLKTYLLDLSGVESAEALIENHYAELVSSVDELQIKIKKNELATVNIDAEKFFRSNALNNIYNTINEIVHTGKGASGAARKSALG